ncbi:MAG: D-aminoacylase, partial [Gemmatimonadetes bacterium]|nr:D-aminoacylase [Gemmatimonadota bacterium]
MRKFRRWAAISAAALLSACATQPREVATYDVLIRGGTLYDGSGGTPYRGDVGITGDRIAFVGQARSAKGKREVDARGLAVAPG